ncbi:U1 small nuclear ribonucleoprotein 70 kDa-like [Lineus longissimus]|uniref:U1 small nuclear ribonucleoprotein 70 kDa-like n=1 Tax=Lineus longissimus TaxID=88925 RepID=UPI002B4D1194
MTAFLPPNLLALFAPRDPLPFLPPVEKPPHYAGHSYGGAASYLGEFEDPKDTPPPTRVETKDERKERKNKERAEQIAYKLEQDLALWDPSNNPQATSDAFKTLFVARINYDTSESKLRREFEVYGPIKTIKIATDKDTGKPRGYAFIEYEHARDMHSAYKHADGKKIDGRRVLVDVERARTVKGWRPRRLGGGLGSTRKGGPDVNSRYSGRDDMNRSRSRSPDRRRRRSRSRERRRSRSRDRKRRSRSRERTDSRADGRRGGRDEERDERRPRGEEEDVAPRRRGRDEEEEAPRRRRRSRSRDRERRRSRSRDRERRRRRSRSRERKPRGGDEIVAKQEKHYAEEGEYGYEDNGNDANGEEEGQYRETEMKVEKFQDDFEGGGKTEYGQYGEGDH